MTGEVPVTLQAEVAMMIHQIVVGGETPSYILFSSEGYRKARQQEAGLQAASFVKDVHDASDDDTYLGLPYRVAAVEEEVTVVTHEQEAREVTPPDPEDQLRNLLSDMTHDLPEMYQHVDKSTRPVLAAGRLVQYIKVNGDAYRITLERKP